MGVDHGKALTKRSLKPKQSYAKGKLQKRVKFVREIVREVVGFAPFEKRCIELLKVGKEKRALKVCDRHRSLPACPTVGACIIGGAGDVGRETLYSPVSACHRVQVCKNKLGSHKRAKAKREEMAEANRQMRMKASA